MSKFKDLYLKTEYEELIPKESNKDKFEYKFNSISHFVRWVELLDKNFQRGSTEKDSDGNPADFCMSENLADAYKVVMGTGFDLQETEKLESFISKIKKNSRFSDDGYELEVPEFLAGSDKYWIEAEDKKTKSRLVDDYLFIDGVYSAFRKAEVAKQTGFNILNEIYRRSVVPRKVVACFPLKRAIDRGDITIFIDVDFNDLNGLAKVLHPSTFRRLCFRVVEICPDVTWGYGTPYMGDTEKGYISIHTAYNLAGKPLEIEIDKFLGTTKAN